MEQYGTNMEQRLSTSMSPFHICMIANLPPFSADLLLHKGYQSFPVTVLYQKELKKNIVFYEYCIPAIKTAEIARSELTVDSDMNELNLDKEKREKLSDTFATVSKITTLYSRNIDKENPKNGIGKLPKQYDDSGMYVNKSVNDDVETIKIDDSDISDSEQNTNTAKKSCSEEFLMEMLQRLNCNNLPCPCRQITLSRFLQNDSKSKESSVIYVPQPEVYKFYELQNMNISENKQSEGASDHEELKNDVAATDEFSLKDKSNVMDDRDQEQYLFTNANAEEYTEVDIQQGKVKNVTKRLKSYGTLSNGNIVLQEQLKPNTDFVAMEILNDKLTSDENSTEIKQCDRQQWNSKKDEKTKWRGTEDIEKDSDDIDKAFGKTVKKYFILSNFRKKCKEKKLSFVNSSDSVKNSFIMERTSKIFKTPLNRGNSLTGRHCSRTQRMEKRATKTLGIVVGVYGTSICKS
ncbi:unnamed protein product [Onchocerca ochengi]|uniref:DNA polymerase delta subunit 3 n=1 Tax=Onchocerca ochengi TaxID=42157 RepID=A0A182DXS4_ONCOC|nr:unnamed protein product [Onchocerca ochengi]